MIQEIHYKKKCVIKLDNFLTTKSNGGVVVWVGCVDKSINSAGDIVWEKTPNEGVEGYLTLDCSEDVEIGWIYQDKTNVLRNPNK